MIVIPGLAVNPGWSQSPAMVKPDDATAIYKKVLFRREKTNIGLVEMMDEPHKAGETISSMEMSSAIGITLQRGMSPKASQEVIRTVSSKLPSFWWCVFPDA